MPAAVGFRLMRRALHLALGQAAPRRRSKSRSTRPSGWRSQHNHTLLAARTKIQQNQAAEITANLRPNPTLFTDWEYLPLFPAAKATSFADLPPSLDRRRHGVELPD